MNWLRRRWAHVSEWGLRNQFFCALLVFGIISSVGFWKESRDMHSAIAAVKASARQEASDNAARIATEAAIITALRDEVNCIQTWAARSTMRTAQITPSSILRVDYLFEAFNAAQKGHHARALAFYRKAVAWNKVFLKKAAKYKIPVPNLNCRRVAIPSPPVVVLPGKTVTRTHTVTRTRTITRTVRVPGPVVTRTVVITVSPGKHRR